MPATTRQSYVYRFSGDGSPAASVPSIDAYAQFLHINKVALRIKDSSLTIREYSTGESSAFAKTVRRDCSRVKGRSIAAIFVEILSVPSVRAIDSIAAILVDVLKAKTARVPSVLFFVVQADTAVSASVVANRLLEPVLKTRAVGTAVLTPTTAGTSRVRWPGRKRRSSELAGMSWTPVGTNSTGTEQLSLSADQIETHIDVLFGHFAFGGTAARHFGALLSLHRLASSPEFVAQVRRDASALVGGGPYQLVPVGMDGSGTDELALQVASDGHSSVVYPSRLENQRPGEGVVILSEMYPSVTDLNPLFARLRLRNVGTIAVVSVARFDCNHSPPSGVEVKTYVDVPYVASGFEGKECPFCAQGVEVQTASDLSGFERKVRAFDEFTFWSLVSSRPDYALVGHWPSKVTSYHYLFRVDATPIFARHAHGLAVRLRNLLLEKGIVGKWVKRIVCAEGEASAVLAEALATVLKLDNDAVVRIPRATFEHLTGRVPHATLRRVLGKNGLLKSLADKNVIIVDQAAHHFSTLGYLEAICNACGSEVLAFAVFLDRVGAGFDYGDDLAHLHYIRLYSWPSPPRRRHECACLEAAAPLP